MGFFLFKALKSSFFHLRIKFFFAIKFLPSVKNNNSKKVNSVYIKRIRKVHDIMLKWKIIIILKVYNSLSISSLKQYNKS